jgi:hypothetical protein
MISTTRDNNEVINFAYYRYDPSMAGAAIFILVFMATTFYHVFQLLKTRTWFFIPFVIGGFCELDKPNKKAKVTDSSSRVHWIYWTRYVKQAEPELDPWSISFTDNVTPPRTSPFSSIHLYAPRSDHPCPTCGITCHPEKAVTDHGVCNW